jgi:hypothetical protein
MFDKKAFVHWFTGEGMEESEFHQARNIIQDICEEYSEANECCSDDDVNVLVENCAYDDCSMCTMCSQTSCNCECINTDDDNEKL